ncbi:MAG: TldD/PmbA family protein [Bacteroidales bacterium]|nr:TldD/PmbA family protein [Bacteroidales bacterium]
MTNNELLELGNWVIKTAKSKGNPECKVSVQKLREVEIQYCNKKPEIIKEAINKNLTLDLYIDGKYSSQSTPDLRKSSLESFIQKSYENTKYIEADPYRFLTDSKYYEELNKELYIHDKGLNSLPIEKRHEIASSVESLCLEKGGDKLVSVESSIMDTEVDRILLTSNGFKGETKSSYISSFTMLTLQDEGDRRPNHYNYLTTRNLKDLPSAEEIAKQTIMAGRNLLGAKKLPTEKLPVIIENKSVPRILNGFIRALYGRSIQQKRSFLADKKGKSVASKYLTLIDNPLLERGLGSRLFDNDGLPSKEMILLNEGKVENFYLDWYYSRKLNTEPTTGRRSNLIIPQGNKSVEELMKSLDRGILITGFIGGNSNSTTGDFSIGVSGMLFENGKPVQAIAEMNIADNHLEFWNKLSAISNDPWKYSSWITPSLVFDDVVISGK